MGADKKPISTWALATHFLMTLGNGYPRTPFAADVDRLKAMLEPIAGETVTRALADVAAERRRQVEVEDWSTGHDDEHERGELALAAACYAMHAGNPEHLPRRSADGLEYARGSVMIPTAWPWAAKWWKPSGVYNNKTKRDDLVRAGALILAEIERLDRTA